jgi:ubiquinone/menaquinone biosynthesis C-methylase UbiE
MRVLQKQASFLVSSQQRPWEPSRWSDATTADLAGFADRQHADDLLTSAESRVTQHERPPRRDEILRCLQCRRALRLVPATEVDRVCAVCGAAVRVDEVAVDLLPTAPPPQTWGARAMQSAWLASVYESCWRPISFALSTTFGAPSAHREARIVLEHVAGTPGPWLDLSCGPGISTRELVAHAEGRAVFAVDRSRAMLERAHHAAPDAILVRADAAELPFADGTFGAVVNLAALDLYADAALVIRESARVLVRGGRWICSTFTARRGPRPGAPLSGGARKPTATELVATAERAGLQRFGSVVFRRYMVAWADKG